MKWGFYSCWASDSAWTVFLNVTLLPIFGYNILNLGLATSVILIWNLKLYIIDEESKENVHYEYKPSHNFSSRLRNTTKDGICLDYNDEEKQWLREELTMNATELRLLNCDRYQSFLADLIYPESGFFPKEKAEKETKLAFSYVAHHQSGLLEILLHLTFRPYNAYCIYVGSNSDPQFIRVVSKLVDCYKKLFPNAAIFMAEKAKPVQWGFYSLLEADLICMEQLLALRDHSWKYLINLAGTELPLYSVDELAQRLTQRPVKYSLLSYYERKFDIRFKYKWGYKKIRGVKQYTRLGKKGPPPFGMKVFKGFKNVILRRDFVDFITQHPVAKKYQNFIKDMRIPDEHYYATLSRITNIEEVVKAGGEIDYVVTQNTKDKRLGSVPGLCQRISLWRYDDCKGATIRQICHLAMQDLKEVDERNKRKKDGKFNCFVANKFDAKIDSSAILCMARRIHFQERNIMQSNLEI